jgi:Fic family protein
MNRAGVFVTVLGQDYKAFEPTKLPPIPKIIIDDEMAYLLGEANRLLGKLDMLSSQIPNINLFLSSYVRKEALMSSQIEGTQTSLVDILDPYIDTNKNADVEEVVNYTKALNYAWDRMNNFPLCNRLLIDTHAVLLQGVRGAEKQPGEFRRSQNWIGAVGCGLKDAKYIPPTPYNMAQAMSDLEKFINSDDEIDPIIKDALIHYQFETIHPFLDGNGRLGRMIIVLYLKEVKLLNYPVLYISYYLKKNRIEYYDRLADVRKSGNYEQWIKFFLKAIVTTCADSIETITEIDKLHKINVCKIPNTKLAGALLTYMEQNPIIDITRTAEILGVTYNGLKKVIAIFEQLDILKETSNKKYNKVYSYIDYLEILKRDTDNI